MPIRDPFSMINDILGPYVPITPEGPLIYDAPGIFEEDAAPEVKAKLRAFFKVCDLTDQEKDHYMRTGEIYDNAEGTRAAMLGIEKKISWH